MTQQSFTNGGDQTSTTEDQVSQTQGNTFSQANDSDPVVTETKVVAPAISTEDLVALKTRDEHAQAHITTLEAEASQRKQELLDLQTKLDQASTVEDVLRAKESVSAIDVDALTATVTKSIVAQNEKLASEQLADNNFSTVSKALTDKFGFVDVDTNVQKICADNDMTWEDMVDLSRKNPKLAMKLCDVEVVKQTQSTKASINFNAFMQQSGETQAQPTKVNVMNLRTDADRVADFQRRMSEFLKTQ